MARQGYFSLLLLFILIFEHCKLSNCNCFPGLKTIQFPVYGTIDLTNQGNKGDKWIVTKVVGIVEIGKSQLRIPRPNC